MMIRKDQGSHKRVGSDALPYVQNGNNYKRE